MSEPTPRLTARDFDPKILEIFDGYVHGKYSKREVLTRFSAFAVGGLTATGILESLQPNYALAQQVAPDDPAIKTERFTYASPKGHGEIKGLLARPANATGKLPSVLVIHENRGLNPYIEDVVRRLAKAGYLALGPDGLTPAGGYPGSDEEGRAMQAKLDPVKLMEDFFAAFDTLEKHADATGKVGAVGFCYGGGVVNALAAARPALAAGAPYYGRQLEAAKVPQIKAPLQLHYAGLDERINAGWPAYEAALKEHGKQFSVHFYPGVNHGFHNDTTPRYDKAAAELAWSRTLEFFDRFVRRTG